MKASEFVLCFLLLKKEFLLKMACRGSATQVNLEHDLPSAELSLRRLPLSNIVFS